MKPRPSPAAERTIPFLPPVPFFLKKRTSRDGHGASLEQRARIVVLAGVFLPGYCSRQHIPRASGSANDEDLTLSGPRRARDRQEVIGFAGVSFALFMDVLSGRGLRAFPRAIDELYLAQASPLRLELFPLRCDTTVRRRARPSLVRRQRPEFCDRDIVTRALKGALEVRHDLEANAFHAPVRHVLTSSSGRCSKGVISGMRSRLTPSSMIVSR